MNEVSCRAFTYFQAAEREGWLRLDALLEGCRVDRARLEDPSQRVDWDDWALLCDRFADLVGFHRLRESARFALQPGFATDVLERVAPLLASPPTVFRAAYQYGAATTYRCVSMDVLEQPGDTIRVTAHLEPGYRPSRAWFEMLVGGADVLLAHVGMPVVVVVDELTGTNAGFVATPRPSRTAWTWARRVTAALTSPRRVAEKFVFQALQLQATYRELAERERNVFEMLARLPAGVALLQGGRLVYANERFANVVGQPVSALLDVEADALFHPDDRARFRELAQHGTADQSLALRVPRGDEVRTLRVSPLERLVFQGAPTRGLFAVDLTDELRARASLERQEETVAAMASASSDVVLRLGAAGEVLDAFGGPQADGGVVRSLRGLPLVQAVDVLPGLDRAALPRLEGAVAGVLRDGAARLLELAGSAGEPVYEYVVTAAAGGEALLVGRDITPRRKQERALAVSERMASLGTLAAGLGHEINNPLTYILENQQALLEGLDALVAGRPVDLAELRALADETRQGAERVRDIVRDLRGFSRVDAASQGVVPLEEAIDEAVRLSAHQLRHQGRLERQVEPVGPVHGDRARVVQVFVNLLVNAAQSLPHGQPDNVVTVRARREGARVVALVKDTGAGIAPQHLAQVFDPFFTTKPAGQGSGLGLAIVHRIMAEAGGAVRIESAPGRGTEVWLEFRPADAAPAVATAAPALRAEAPGRRRVLLIDDEPLVARALARGLKAFEVAVAHSGAEAMARLAAERFDAVVCDLNMPGQDGVDVYEAARAQDPGLPGRFVLLTGGAFTERAHRFLEEHRPRVLQKPATAAEVQRQLDDCLAGGDGRGRA